jgi:hypothetical protein
MKKGKKGPSPMDLSEMIKGAGRSEMTSLFFLLFFILYPSSFILSYC